MKLRDTPSAENLPTYQEQPVSGNDINGLGVNDRWGQSKIILKRVIGHDRHDFTLTPGFGGSCRQMQYLPYRQQTTLPSWITSSG